MAEYLSPGVYVEEFDSGIKAMEGVGTSTAGFVGMAQKGPIRGLPVLITSVADYQRRFGGYLSEREYGEKRFLPYAVEQFFNNGGSTCYVMRVCREQKEETKKADAGAGDSGAEAGDSGAGGTGTEGGGTGGTGADGAKKGAVRAFAEVHSKADTGENIFLKLKAADPGAWGNRIQAAFVLKLKGKVKAVPVEGEAGSYTVSDAKAFQKGDLIYSPTADKEEPRFYKVEKAEGSKVTLSWEKKGGSQEEPLNFYLAEWNLTVEDETASEQYADVSFNADNIRYIEHVLSRSYLITAKADMSLLASGDLEQIMQEGDEPFFTVNFQGGDEGDLDFDASLYMGEDGAPDQRTGLKAFQTISDVSIMAIPGITDPSVQSDLVSHCENMGNRFAVLDMPQEAREVSELQQFKENIDSSYAAMYHPWLQCYDSLTKRNTFLPPSGSIAGIYGRTDNSRGVHKAPANETVRNCTGLSVNYNEAEQGKLNPKGINLIRALPGQGIRVWGARTCSSDGNWKYVNVRRLFIYIEESIKVNTNWAVFEPNDEILWSRVEGTIRVFLTTQWRNGALAGSTPEEAFFINIGKSTMTQDDILNGRMICVIGVAPVRPAEFIIFRITQKMENAQ